ncbi:HAD family hydrolase [Arthrobacter sp.]|uniref:HAD family hydrolase n=1 Tax=Arthrobacter sp. TaxID=1667 RepID=UPI002811FB8B|nr:HAD family hydrolase [Arthrobacter sp.]
MSAGGTSFQQGQGASPFKLVIFDCDGVLVDSETIAIRVDQRVLADLGWDLQLDEIVRRFVGKSEADFVAQVEEHLEITLPAGWDHGYQGWYQRALDLHLRAVDGIEEALDRLVLPHCVASSGTHSKIRRTLGKTGLLPRFEGRIFSAQDVRRGKPEPDLFLHAAESLGFRPEECAVVEDSIHGVEAARAARMHVFAFSGGVTPASALAGRATTVFDRMTLLPDLLAGELPF